MNAIRECTLADFDRLYGGLDGSGGASLDDGVFVMTASETAGGGGFCSAVRARVLRGAAGGADFSGAADVFRIRRAECDAETAVSDESFAMTVNFILEALADSLISGADVEYYRKRRFEAWPVSASFSCGGITLTAAGSEWAAAAALPAEWTRKTDGGEQVWSRRGTVPTRWTQAPSILEVRKEELVQ